MTTRLLTALTLAAALAAPSATAQKKKPDLPVPGPRDARAGADFDGDGRPDLAVGVPGEGLGSRGGAGAVQVVYGASPGTPAVREQLLTQDSPGVAGVPERRDQFGGAVAAGDFNGDRFDDLAVGVPGENIGRTVDAGSVVVVYGSATGLGPSSVTLTQGTAGAPETPERGDALGASLAAGDLNGDRRADLAAGAPGEDGKQGAAVAFYGSRGGSQATGSRLVSQDLAGVHGRAERGDEFADSVAIGDLNGDGTGDLAAGVPSEDIGSRPGAGGVTILRGSDRGGVTAEGDQFVTQDSPGVPGRVESRDGFGRSVAVTDVDGDDDGDLAVGAPGENLGRDTDAGGFHVLPGSSVGVTGSGSSFVSQDSGGVPGGAEPRDGLGRALAASDFNGDGRGDLAVGAPGESIGRATRAGAAYAFYGAQSGFARSQLITQNSAGIAGRAEDDDRLGAALGTVAAVPGGHAALAAGAPGETVRSRPAAGSLNLVAGSASGLVAAGNRLVYQGGGLSGRAERGDLLADALSLGG